MPLQIAFNAFDLDGNGTLDPTELSHVVSMLDTGNRSQNEDLKDRAYRCFFTLCSMFHVATRVCHFAGLERAFVALDEDGDGQVSWDEFKNGIERDPFLAEVLLGHLQTKTGPEAARRRPSARLSKSDVELLEAATASKPDHLERPIEDFDSPPSASKACCTIM